MNAKNELAKLFGGNNIYRPKKVCPPPEPELSVNYRYLVGHDEFKNVFVKKVRIIDDTPTFWRVTEDIKDAYSGALIEWDEDPDDLFKTAEGALEMMKKWADDIKKEFDETNKTNQRTIEKFRNETKW